MRRSHLQLNCRCTPPSILSGAKTIPHLEHNDLSLGPSVWQHCPIWVKPSFLSPPPIVAYQADARRSLLRTKTSGMDWVQSSPIRLSGDHLSVTLLKTSGITTLDLWYGHCNAGCKCLTFELLLREYEKMEWLSIFLTTSFPIVNTSSTLVISFAVMIWRNDLSSKNRHSAVQFGSNLNKPHPWSLWRWITPYVVHYYFSHGKVVRR